MFRNRPYVYKLIHKETGQFYIGYRCANAVSSEYDLGIRYKSSSEEVKRLGFVNFNYYTIFETIGEDRVVAAKSAYFVEQLLISECIGSELCLNRHFIKNGKGNFNTIGLTMSDKQKDLLRNRVVSQETRRKMGDKKRGVPHTQYQRDCLRNSILGNTWMIGKKMSEETKNKMSKTRTGMTQTPEHKENCRLSKIGIKQSEERKRINSESHKGLKASEETKLKMSISHMGNKNRAGKVASEETKTKMRAARALYELNKKQNKEKLNVV